MIKHNLKKKTVEVIVIPIERTLTITGLYFLIKQIFAIITIPQINKYIYPQLKGL